MEDLELAKLWKDACEFREKFYASGGRLACIRCSNSNTNTTDFCKIPVHVDGVNPNRMAESNVLKPFLKSSTLSGLSAFDAIGSDLFCVGGPGGVTTNYDTIPDETCKINRFSIFLDDDNGKFIDHKMFSPRTYPYTIVMDKKLHIFGGLARPNDLWAEIFDPCSNLSLPLGSPPSPLTSCPLVIAALHSWKKILMACCTSNSAYLFDVIKQDWIELDHKIDFSAVRGKAAVVRNSTLCWFDETFHVLHAYDLGLKMWFREPIKGLDKVGVLFSDVPETECSLLPLDDNHLYLLWIDHTGYANTYDTLLHCTKVCVSIDDGTHDMVRFDASVVSSGSYVLEPTRRFLDAVVVNSVQGANPPSSSAQLCLSLAMEKHETLAQHLAKQRYTGVSRGGDCKTLAHYLAKHKIPTPMPKRRPTHCVV